MEPNPKVKIISDSTCDLSQELTAKYDIDILPLHILLGENEFRDGKDTTPDRIFAWADANKATPKTSAPSLEDAKVLLQPYVEAGREVICFSISGSMSTSGNVMRLAAEDLDAAAQVTIIDSENLSTGIGLLVLEAAILAEQGHTAAEITAAVTPDSIPKISPHPSARNAAGSFVMGVPRVTMSDRPRYIYEVARVMMKALMRVK